MSKKILHKSENGLTGSGLDPKNPLPPFYHWWQARLLSSFYPNMHNPYHIMGFGECWEEGEVVWLQFSGSLWKAPLWVHPEEILKEIQKQKDTELKELFDARNN